MTAKTAVHSSWLDVIEDRTVTHRIGHSRGSLKPACMHAAWYLGRQMCARIPDACDELTKNGGLLLALAARSPRLSVTLRVTRRQATYALA